MRERLAGLLNRRSAREEETDEKLKETASALQAAYCERQARDTAPASSSCVVCLHCCRCPVRRCRIRTDTPVHLPVHSAFAAILTACPHVARRYVTDCTRPSALPLLPCARLVRTPGAFRMASAFR